MAPWHTLTFRLGPRRPEWPEERFLRPPIQIEVATRPSDMKPSKTPRRFFAANVLEGGIRTGRPPHVAPFGVPRGIGLPSAQRKNETGLLLCPALASRHHSLDPPP